MADDTSELLNVRETAKRLGVHENTVRNWARQGLLVDTRLPGSRYHRFRADDVERLRTQRGTAAPTLQSERRVVNTELVGASQLDQWPNVRSRDAQSTFPELIRRLVSETPGTSIVTLRSSDGVAIAGVDGILESEGLTAYLPAGRVILELGVGANPRAKATTDYQKRVSEGLGDCAFVFATPRRWGGATKWAEERRAEGRFRDVRVIDADLLEGWLVEAPSAHHWISEHLGLRPRAAISLDTWWQRFSTSTDPILPLSLFASGRTAQLEALRSHLSKEPHLTAIECEWASDGLAFVQAAVRLDPPPGLLTTPLIVSDEDVWDRVVERMGRAILVPEFDGADVDAAINAGHHVITVLDPSHSPTRAVDITLPRLDRTQASEALQKADVEWSAANSLAALARRSLPAFTRRLSRNPQVRRPRWAEPPEATRLAELMLVGAWTGSEDDQALLAELTQSSRADLEVLLRWAAAAPDPLFRNVDDHWRLSSPEEAFLVLSESLTPSAVQRWADLVHDVLLDPDPFHGMEDHERLAAQMKGARRRYSATLRHGIAQGLAMTGAMGGSSGAGLSSDFAGRIVKRLLGDARRDQGGEHWAELADVLPLLAEASPDDFLGALEDDLALDEPSVASLFVGRSSRLSLGPTTQHPSLLWAVETLCWSPDFIVRGAQILAHLCRFELPENSGNNPLASLGSVLCGWVRHTSADLQLRIEALDAVYATSKETGWQLLLGLMPSNHAVAWPPSRPDFRLWVPSSPSVPMSEWVSFVHSLVERVVTWSTEDPQRLPLILDCIGVLSTNDRSRLIDHLEDKSGELDPDTRLKLFEALQSLVADHEKFAMADWAMPAEARDRLATLRDTLEPEDDPRRLAHWFDWHPDFSDIDPKDFDKYQAALSEHRRKAIDAVFALEEPIPHLEEIARRAKAPRFLGWHLAERTEVGPDEAIEWLCAGESPIQDAAMAWLERLFRADPTVLSDVLARGDLADDVRSLVLRSVAPERGVWAILKNHPADERLYWSSMNLDVVQPEDTLEAIEKLMMHGRPWTAIAVASFAVHERPGRESKPDSGITPEIVVEILRSAITADPGDNGIGQMTTYYIGQLLDYLEASGASQLELAQLEFAYYRLLEHTREPRALSRALATDPHLFVDFVRRVYRGKNEKVSPKRTPDNMATQAMWVLHGWHGFPGRTNEGTVDADVMREWVTTARLELSEIDRSDIGDEVIGQAFAHSPPDEDGIWPSRPVRELIEVVGSRELEHGFVLGRLNSRGVTSRGVYEGGDQERKLAARYRDWSRMVQTESPRSARILRLIAESYERDALREDREAQIDQDRD